MSAQSSNKLVINNPVPVLDPCGANSSFNSDGSRNLTNGKQTGIIPYGDQPSPERDNYVEYWEELITNFGMRMKYWQHGYDLDKHDFLYGEHPTAKFEEDELIMCMAEKAGESAMFSKFGFQGAAELTLVVEIPEFDRVFGADSRPKPGDVFTFPDVYSDRPNGLGQKLFEVTNPNDDEMSTTFLGGHYVWFLEAVRWDPSWEDGAPSEPGDDMVSDDSPIGLLPGFNQPPSKPKVYDDEIDEEVKDDFDQDVSGGGQDDVYGDF